VWDALPRGLFVCALFSGMECPVYFRNTSAPPLWKRRSKP